MRSLKGKRVLIWGLGLLGGGTSVTNWLLKEGAIVTVTDLKTKKELSPSIANIREKNKVTWHLGGHVKEDFENADLIIRNPGVPDKSPFLGIAQKSKIPVYNEATLFFEIVKRPIVAVTGTRGKSTTSTLIYEFLKKKYIHTVIAGNRGDVPMFSVINTLKKSVKDPIVLELSSWQVEGLQVIKKSPHVAVLTNLYPDHLNRYSSLKAYYKAKLVLFKFQKQSDYAVLNASNKEVIKLTKRVPAQKHWFSSVHARLEGVSVADGKLLYAKDVKQDAIISLDEIALKGAHNIENIAAAVSVAKLYGIANKDIARVLKRFKGIWGRQQVLGKVQGRNIINDTAASNPQGLKAFIQTHPGSLIIAGGNNKGLSYAPLKGLLTLKHVQGLILLPGTATKLIEKLTSKKVPVYKEPTLKRAVEKAFRITKEGDTIALSPGATSFSQFANEFERGRMFETLVKAKS